MVLGQGDVVQTGVDAYHVGGVVAQYGYFVEGVGPGGDVVEFAAYDAYFKQCAAFDGEASLEQVSYGVGGVGEVFFGQEAEVACVEAAYRYLLFGHTLRGAQQGAVAADAQCEVGGGYVGGEYAPVGRWAVWPQQ